MRFSIRLFFVDKTLHIYLKGDTFVLFMKHANAPSLREFHNFISLVHINPFRKCRGKGDNLGADVGAEREEAELRGRHLCHLIFSHFD